MCPHPGSTGLHRTHWAPLAGLLLLLVCGALGGACTPRLSALRGAATATPLQRWPPGTLGPIWRAGAARGRTVLCLRGGASESSDDDPQDDTDTATGDDDDDSSASAGAAAYGGGAVEDSYVSRYAARLRGAARRAPNLRLSCALRVPCCARVAPGGAARPPVAGGPVAVSAQRSANADCCGDWGAAPLRAPTLQSPGPKPGPLRGRVSEAGTRGATRAPLRAAHPKRAGGKGWKLAC